MRVKLDENFGRRGVEYSGLVVVRPRGRAEPADLDRALRLVAAGLHSRPVAGKLWVVEPGRLREYQPDN